MLVKDILKYLNGDIENITVWLLDRDGGNHEGHRSIKDYGEAEIFDIWFENGELSFTVDGETLDYLHDTYE